MAYVDDYPEVENNQWVKPIRKGYRMGCCDCGLVHEIDFKLVPWVNGGKVIMIRARRHESETKRLRKIMKREKKLKKSG